MINYKELLNLFGKNESRLNYLEERRFVAKPEQIKDNWIKLGWAIDFLGAKIYGRNLYLIIDPEQNPRISVLGMTGSGKTSLVSWLIFDAYLKNFKTIIAFDHAGEYKHKLKAIARRTNYPFLKIMELSPPFLDYPSRKFYLSFDELEVDDLMFLFGIDEKSVVGQLLDYLCSVKNIKSIEMMKRILSNANLFKTFTGGLFNTKTALTLLRILTKEERMKFFRAENLKLEDIIFNDYIIDFVYRGYTLQEILSNTYVALFVKKLRDMLSNMYKNREVIKLITVFEESHFLVPAITKPPSSREILRSVRTTRKFGETMIFVTQNHRKMNWEIINQSRYVLFPITYSQDDVKKIFSNTYVPQEKEELYLEYYFNWGKVLYRKFGLVTWLLLDKVAFELEIFIPENYIINNPWIYKYLEEGFL